MDWLTRFAILTLIVSAVGMGWSLRGLWDRRRRRQARENSPCEICGRPGDWLVVHLDRDAGTVREVNLCFEHCKENVEWIGKGM